MAIVIADRVKVTTTTTGTGTLTLGSAVTGFQDFGAIGDGNETYYTISVPGGADWEVGIGTYTASGTTLSRDTILASSNGGSAVNFSAGTKDVFVTYPSERSVVSYDGNNSEFTSTTRMIFAQETAPPGWTKDTTNYNNHALRIITGAASPGGTIDFTTAFASQAVIGNIAASTGPTTATGTNGPTAAPIANTTATGSIGPTAAPIGSTAAPIANATAGGTVGPTAAPIGNAASPNGNTTLAVPTIPSHSHVISRGSGPSFGVRLDTYSATPGPLSLGSTNTTGGGGAHTHPAGNHVHPSPGHTHPFTGSAHTHASPAHTHPSPAHTHPFTGTAHTHASPAHTHPFTGVAHNHPATATFTGTDINLAVKYVDAITATKD